MLMEAFAQARLRHPADQWLDVRYEDLVERPREQVGRMLDFLGLGWSAAFEKGFSRYDFTVGRAEAYRDELSPAQLGAIERVLEKPLAEWGYPV
jgi:hypothetical protein